ncbi:hypothetical protein [Amnibacterium kyonggiense]
MAPLTAPRPTDPAVLEDHAERGDVPGWVLVTMMIAGLVVLLWGVAGPALSSMFTNALASVTGP